MAEAMDVSEDPNALVPLSPPMVSVSLDTAPADDHHEVVLEAKRRWDKLSEYEALSRRNYREDTKYSEGDDFNGWQWPGGMREGRSRANKPSLTINVIRQHNLQIINEARKAKASVKVVATGGDASAEAAVGWRACIRRVEYQSNAQDIYYTALKNAVRGGIGWWRIITKYASEESFDQEIYLMAVPDSMTVYIDPGCQLLDKSDARYGYVFGQIDQDDFKASFPEYKSLSEGGNNRAPLGVSSVGDTGTFNENSIWFAEYFRKVKKPVMLVSFLDEQGFRKTLRRDKMPDSVWEKLKSDSSTRTRMSSRDDVQWFLIVGEEVVDTTSWPGKYIPLIPVIGEETVIDGILDRKGHTRWLRDPQRMYNFNASSQAEFIGLQTRTPWVTPARAIEGVETYWNRANVDNSSVLPYNDIDDAGNEIQAPQRAPIPTNAPAFEAGMQTAWMQMMMASGQWQNQMGVQGNERTGAAIQARQGQADNAVAHFQDNFASALRYSGRQIIDLIPKIYDTQRVFRIIDEDGTQTEMQIDPRARQAMQVRRSIRGEAISRILNPMLGDYDIAADVGPSYATKRQETVEKLTTILTEAPALTGIIGDILLRNLDIDEAIEAAQRLKRMVPPQALGIGPTQNEQVLQQQVQQLQQVLRKMQDQLSRSISTAAKDKVKLAGKDSMREIDIYDAETRRMGALQKLLPLDADGLKQVIHELVEDALQTRLEQVFQASAAGVGEQSGDEADVISAPQLPPPGSGAASGLVSFARNPHYQRGGMYFAPLVNDRKLPGQAG